MHHISDSGGCFTYLRSRGVVLVLQVVFLPVDIEPSRLTPPCLLILQDAVHVVTVDDDVMMMM